MDEWADLLDEQHGVLSGAQASEFGISPSAITAQLTAGRWQRVVQRVYATHTGPLSVAARREAALLYAGPRALLSHRSAAECWGMLTVQDGPVHVTVPYGASAISQDGLVVVHRSRAHAHIAVPARRPLTGRADTALDLAVAEPTPRDAMRILTSLLTTRGVAATDVAHRLTERPPRRYRRALAAAVQRVLEGVQSVLEEHYAVEVEQAHALPRALRQAPVAVDGRTLFEDAVYDHVGVPLTVRLDGRTHLTPRVALTDRRRDNTAELTGRSRLVFGWVEVSSTPCAVAAEVLAVLLRRGWEGPTRQCARCA